MDRRLGLNDPEHKAKNPSVPRTLPHFSSTTDENAATELPYQLILSRHFFFGAANTTAEVLDDLTLQVDGLLTEEKPPGDVNLRHPLPVQAFDEPALGFRQPVEETPHGLGDLEGRMDACRCRPSCRCLWIRDLAVW